MLSYRMVAFSLLEMGMSGSFRRFFALIFAVVVLSEVRHASAQTTFRGMTVGTNTAQDLVDLRGLGANLVAYQIAVGINTTTPLSETDYNTYLDAKLAIIDDLLTTCEANGMRMMLVLFTPPGAMNQSASPARHRLFESNAYDQQFVSTWQSIATRYKGRSGIFGYDLLNEPAVGKVGPGIALWNTLSQSALSAIRQIDPEVRVILEPPYGNAEFINKLAHITDSNLTYSVHSYFTSAFRNQGLNGRPITIPYPKVNKKDPTKGFTKVTLKKSLSKAQTFQRQRKGTPVMVGEFAAPRWAPNGSAARYLKDSINLFEKNRWDWANHAWREADVWSPEYSSDPQSHVPSPTMTDRELLLRMFFARNSH